MNLSRESNNEIVNVSKHKQKPKKNKKHSQTQLLCQQKLSTCGTKILNLKSSPSSLTTNIGSATYGQDSIFTFDSSILENENHQYNTNNYFKFNHVQNNSSEIKEIGRGPEEYLNMEQRKSPQKILDNEKIPKFERSNSFSIRTKFSKLLTTTKGSENLEAKVCENVKVPYSFTRSRSMIMLRRSNWRSLIQPQLEQLSEEAERKVDNIPTASARNKLLIENSNRVKSVQLQSLMERNSLSEEKKKNNPQVNFQKKRSNTLIASFKSTFAGLSSSSNSTDKNKGNLNPKWTASLQSLQAIDNMVSYENMSFIDYDKFNGYEKQLERRSSELCLQTTLRHQNSLPTPHFPSPLLSDVLSVSSMSLPMCPSSLKQTPHNIMHRSLALRYALPGNSLQKKFSFYTVNNHKFHEFHSLDSRKLLLLNNLSRSLTTFDKHINKEINFNDELVDPHCLAYSKRKSDSEISNAKDEVDGYKGYQLKSKSISCLAELYSRKFHKKELILPSPVFWKQPNKISGSEYFSVNFFNKSSCKDEEFIQATEGTSLISAISNILERYNLTFSEVLIFDITPSPNILDKVLSPVQILLNENMDIGQFIGRQLLITKRDISQKSLEEITSVVSRTRLSARLSFTSIVTYIEFAITIGKLIKPRFKGFFSPKNFTQHKLCELLNSYAKNGVIPKSSMLNFDYPHYNAALAYLYYMHKSWHDFIKYNGLSDNEIKIQTAIWELVTTEVFYILALQTVTDLFSAYLKAAQEEGLLLDVGQQKLFSNVHEILKANLRFWTIYLYPMIAHSVITRKPMQFGFFSEGFTAFPLIFASYRNYCMDQSSCQFYCKELSRTNPLFTLYLTWCESQKMCNRLKLVDLLVRPMQRLTKYNLLLAAIKKNMQNANEIEEINKMVHSVDSFVSNINNHITLRQESERLKGVIARIESYEVVESNNYQLDKLVKQHSKVFDLNTPMIGCPAYQVRHLFMEGDHKLKDNLGKVDVHCFLLTDMFLICKEIGKKGQSALKIIRQPYMTDRLVIHYCANNKALNCIYLNEFQTAITAFVLQCPEAKNWFESFRRAKIIYTRLKNGSCGHSDDLSFDNICQ